MCFIFIGVYSIGPMRLPSLTNNSVERPTVHMGLQLHDFRHSAYIYRTNEPTGNNDIVTILRCNDMVRYLSKEHGEKKLEQI